MKCARILPFRDSFISATHWQFPRTTQSHWSMNLTVKSLHPSFTIHQEPQLTVRFDPLNTWGELVGSLWYSLSDFIGWEYTPWKRTKLQNSYFVKAWPESVNKVTSSQMIDILRERSHCLWKWEGCDIAFDKLGKVRTPFAKIGIQPLSQITLLFHESFMHTVPRQVHNGSFLIKALCDFMNLWTPFFFNCHNPGDNTALFIFKCCLELNIERPFFCFLLFGFI